MKEKERPCPSKSTPASAMVILVCPENDCTQRYEATEALGPNYGKT